MFVEPLPFLDLTRTQFVIARIEQTRRSRSRGGARCLKMQLFRTTGKVSLRAQRGNPVDPGASFAADAVATASRLPRRKRLAMTTSC